VRLAENALAPAHGTIPEVSMSFSKRQLLPDEKIIRVAHPSWVLLLKPILLNIVAAAIVLTLAALFQQPWLAVLLVFSLAVLGWEMFARRRNEYIVTSRRVVKQEGIFTIHSFDAPLDKINNIFHEQGVWGRILGYGSVGLETASEQGTTMFHHIPDPIGFKNCIVGQRESYSGGAGRATAQAADIPKLLDELASLRDRKIITDREFEEKKQHLLEKL
jgi:membrane protein YdbS with pleckstrin-like domain